MSVYRGDCPCSATNFTANRYRLIYLFPGLGASEKLFRAYDFSPYEGKVISFLVPQKNETLEHYCKRMAAAIDESKERIYIGVSFGGIVAQEIARFLPPNKIIIVSSIKHRGEKPRYFSWLRRIPVHRILPAGLIKDFGVIVSGLVAKKSPSEKKLFRELVRDADTRIIKWGIDQVIRWDQNISPNGLVHIHGDRDIVFPIRRIKPDFIIHGGKHFMIMREVKEIQSLLLKQIHAVSQTNQ